MTSAKARAGDIVSCGMEMNVRPGETTRAFGRYRVECFDKDGNLKWAAESDNLVVNTGLQYMAGAGLTGTAPITSWFIGLYGAGATNTPAATDTMASHPGWTEFLGYTEATRQAAVFAPATLTSPSMVSNIASPAVFTANTMGVVGGAFLTSSDIKNGTAGLLFSAADFSAPGDRTVASGDTIRATYNFNLTP